MKTFLILSITLFVVVMLPACSLAGGPGAHVRDPIGSVPTRMLQDDATPTPMVARTATSFPPMLFTSTPFTPFPPNTPVWLAYSYVCESVTSGSTLTMSLTWFDRSDSEEGYHVYRDNQIIATLAPNSTFFMDATFVANGEMLSYFIEAFTPEWRVSSSTITYGCQ